MMKMKIKKCIYNVHPVYDLYGADKDGNIINIIKKSTNEGKQTCYWIYEMLCKEIWW